MYGSRNQDMHDCIIYSNRLCLLYSSFDIIWTNVSARLLEDGDHGIIIHTIRCAVDVLDTTY